MWNRLLFISAVTWKTDRTWQYLSTIHFFLFHYYWLYLYSYSSCLSYFFILFHKFLPLGLLKLCTPTNTPSSTLSDTLILFNKCCFCPVFAYKAKKNKSFHDWVFSLTINLKLFFKNNFWGRVPSWCNWWLCNWTALQLHPSTLSTSCRTLMFALCDLTPHLIAENFCPEIITHQMLSGYIMQMYRLCLAFSRMLSHFCVAGRDNDVLVVPHHPS